jgi:hypothetical protein
VRTSLREPLTRVGVVLAAALGLTMLSAGCGGGGHHTTVEETLQNALNHLSPQQRSAFPIGAGPPRVKKNSCKKIGKPLPPPKQPILGAPPPRAYPDHLAFWSCVVRFAHVPFHLRVALRADGKIAWAVLMPRQVLRPATATVYQGGPKQPKP